jgi:hypothetical protein
MRSHSDDDIASCEGRGLQVRVGLLHGPQQLDFGVILSGKKLIKLRIEQHTDVLGT